LANRMTSLIRHSQLITAKPADIFDIIMVPLLSQNLYVGRKKGQIRKSQAYKRIISKSMCGIRRPLRVSQIEIRNSRFINFWQ